MSQESHCGTDSSDNEATIGAGPRRDFLRKAAVGTGAIWVTPTLLATPAFAQGSDCNTLRWGALSGVSYPDVSGAPDPYVPGPGTNYRSIYFVPVPGSMPVGPITVTHSIINSTPPLVDSTSPFDPYPAGYLWISYEAFGAANNAWMYRIQLAHGVTGSPNQVTLRFGFSAPVVDLELIISDIDIASNGTSWQDRLVINGTLAGGSALPFSESRTVPANITYTPPNTFLGVNVAGNQTTDGQLTARFDQSGNNWVDQVDIVYQRAAGSGSQGIAIRDLTWGFCP